MPRHEFQFYEMFCSVERTFLAVFHIDVNAAKEDNDIVQYHDTHLYETHVKRWSLFR